MPDVVVVGAGLSGLTAARRLVARGAEVVVVDKAGRPGGRLATRRLGEGRDDQHSRAVADHGAQFFTVRSDDFAAAISDWPVTVWHHGPARAHDVRDGPDGITGEGDGHPRYVGTGGMNGIAKHLAAGLDVRTGRRVQAITGDGDAWQVWFGAGEDLHAAAVIATPPVPQTVALLDGVAVPDDVDRLTYDPCIALLAVLDRKLRWPAVQFDTGVVHYLADNASKGISAVPTLTVHAAPAWSAVHLDSPEEHVVASLSRLVAPWLGGAKVVTVEVKRWRYSAPVRTHPDQAVTVAAGLVLAGDAFGEARVEGATLSGLAAADAISLT